MRTWRIMALVSFSVALTGCAVPGTFWSETTSEGPLTSGTGRAQVVKKCDSGPSGVSDVTRCRWAFVDHRGEKVDVTDGVQKLLDEFMPRVAALQPWVKVAHEGRSPAAPQRGVVPYRFHIVTISPVVLLVVPRQPGDTDYCSGRWPEQGCLPSRRFTLEPYWYKKPPRAVAGAFWIAPELGVTSGTIESASTEVFIPLPDSRLRLLPKGGYWTITREMAAGKRLS